MKLTLSLLTFLVTTTAVIAEAERGRCESKQRDNLALDEIYAPATILEQNRGEVNATECLLKCCNMMKDGCNTVSFYQTAQGSVCLLINCPNEDQCVWVFYPGALAAKISLVEGNATTTTPGGANGTENGTFTTPPDSNVTSVSTVTANITSGNVTTVHMPNNQTSALNTTQIPTLENVTASTSDTVMEVQAVTISRTTTAENSTLSPDTGATGRTGTETTSSTTADTFSSTSNTPPSGGNEQGTIYATPLAAPTQPGGDQSEGAQPSEKNTLPSVVPSPNHHHRVGGELPHHHEPPVKGIAIGCFFAVLALVIIVLLVATKLCPSKKRSDYRRLHEDYIFDDQYEPFTDE